MLRMMANSFSSGLRFFSAKTTKEMAQELRDEIGRNCVRFKTVNTFVHIDLAGRAHYDKNSAAYIPTPHVHFHAIHTTFYGKTRINKQSVTVAATKDDVRLARKLAGKG